MRLLLSAVVGLSAMLAFASSAYADNQRPSIVNGLYSADGSANSVRIGWNKPWDNTGIDGYNIYRNGSYIATVYDTSFSDSNLQSGTNYEYQITAFDPARNYSEMSSAVSYQTSGQQSTNNSTTDTGNSNSGSTQSQTQAQALPANVPTDVRGTEVAQGTVKWEWSWVPGATQYEVTVDGLWAGVTPDTTFFSRDLWAGGHSVSVKSIDGDWKYSNKSHTAKINVSDNYDASSANRSYLDGFEQPVTASIVAPPAPPAPEPTPQAQPLEDFGPDNGLVDPRTRADSSAQKDGYNLVFSDEFNSNSINPARWATNLRWDGEYNGVRYEYRVINNEDQFYVSTLSEDWEHKEVAVPLHNPFEFDGSRLAIRAKRNPQQTNKNGYGYGPLRDMISQQSFLSGALSTHNTFARKYGYFEARIKIPSHVGTFPAFWLYHKNRKWEGTQRSEIDIMENLGHAPWYVYNSMHYFTNVSNTYQGEPHFIRPEPQGQVYTGKDYSQDYHVYAVQWEPGYVKWLIDGEKTSEAWHWSANNEELYLILNLAIGGNWTNYPANAGGLGRPEWDHFPNDNDLNNFSNPALEIDYVRVYEKR